MKRSSLIYGFNPYALRSAGRNDPLVAVSLQELARIGIPGAQGPARDAGTAGAGGGRPELARARNAAQAGAPHCGAAVVGAPARGKNRTPGGNIPVLFYCPGGCGVCYNGCTAPLGRGELHRLRGSQPRRRE